MWGWEEANRSTMQSSQDKCPDIVWGVEPWQPFPQDCWDEGIALWGWPKALSGSKLNRGPAARAQELV